jgi:hypothetical protein
MQDDKTVKWFERQGLTPPSSTPHGVNLDDLSDKLRPLKPRSWKLEGNRLVAKTDLGDVVNYIDPGVIMTGVDENNLPQFKRIIP